MARRNPGTVFPIDLSGAEPLHRQIYEQLRRAILNGQLASGTALPSTRRFAETLGISRTTVVCAYEQLLAEGYIEGKSGAGTYVALLLPEDAPLKNTPRQSSATPADDRPLSMAGEYFKRVMQARQPLGVISTTFPLGIPDVQAFPLRDWQRAVITSQQRLKHDLLLSAEPAGYRPLREALAAYLRTARAVNCTADQILILRGTQQAIALTAQLLLEKGDPVWVENPGYRMAWLALESLGATLVPLSVDSGGIALEDGLTLDRPAKLVYVTPSHQFPLGITMKLPRRLALLHWAAQSGAWILEDDYDSELRFTERPLPSLQGLDDQARVIYMGTFNKIMFPALRVGYMVVPAPLVDLFSFAHSIYGGGPPLLVQAALAHFLEQGLLERHIRRMRLLYAERQRIFLDAARRLEPWLEFVPDSTGMHLVGWLAAPLDEWAIRKRAAGQNILVTPLSQLSLKPLSRRGLVFGYTAADESTLRSAIKRLADVLRDLAEDVQPRT